MKVSVIIPVYRTERFIERCALSLLDQTYTDLELIFVDDCGGDNSISILEEVVARYPERVVKIVRQPKNLGSAMARQRGMDEASGEYVIQVDSDDYVAADYIEELVRSAEEASADVAICDFMYDYGTRQEHRHVNPPTGAHSLLNSVLAGSIHSGLWNKLVRRNIFVEHNIRFTEGLNMFDDKSVFYRVADHADRIAYLAKPLYIYNKTNEGSITARNKSKAIEPALMLIEQMEDYFCKRDVSKDVRQSIEYFKANVMRLILLYNPVKEAQKKEERLGSFSIRTVLTHPELKTVYKIMLLCYKAHLYPLVSLLRGIIVHKM
ncbi:MAG: glycosyltransferase family 2 protein [Muribaculaceae bacterium]|nr:glycosyltransferase family 2 protein [Muribaculaceae bacterium]